jgi:glycosidase
MRSKTRPALGALLVLLLVPIARAQTPPPPVRSGPPSWAAESVFYEVVLDRFRNGDPRNDPRPADIRGAWPYETPNGWQVSSWTGDWYKLQPWEKAGGHDFYWNVPTRRYGGDLQGLLDKLDHIQSLGANAILLAPIFEAPSALKQDPTFLHHVDNNFGPDPESDRLLWATENPADPSTWKWSAADRLFLRVLQECHRRQLKVVVDGIFDHVGMTFWAFRDVRARGAQSRYAGWFQVKTFDDPQTPGDELEYSSLGGARELPELRREASGLAAGPRDHLKAVLRRWSDPNGDGDPSDGVDGWRVRHVDRLPHPFWRDLRRSVLAANPEAYLVGEVFWEDFDAGRLTNPAAWLRGDEFDAVTNHRWTEAVQSFVVDRKAPLAASELEARLTALRSDAFPQTTLAMLNLLDGAELDRIASRVVNPDRPYDHQASPRDDPSYDVRAPSPEEGKRRRLAAAFQFAYAGLPVVYYGTESGLWGADEPDNRKPMLWPDLRYEDEASLPSGQSRRRDPVRVDADLLRYYQALGKARAALGSLRRGSVENLLADDARRLLVFARAAEGEERVVAIFNASDKDQSVEVPFATASRDHLTGRRFRPREGKTIVPVPAFSAVYLGPDAGREPK